MLKYIALILIFSGLVLSSYLTYLTLTLSACPISGGCDLVITSNYSKLFGIPVSLLGIIGFIAMAFSLQRNLLFPLLILGVLGLAFIIYLEYIQLAIIKALCPFCIATHTLYLISFVISVLSTKTNRA
ncbi:MAG TPA: vitamin K epoxide reductase family protein [Geobacterales bacterium]|nr:vitamin K epoxide reductase family protein [Geobacterales bacterium]